jgi:Flp pilus assembly protein TadB
MKIIAVILLVLGIGLCAVGAYGYLFSSDYEQCQRQSALAAEKLKEARAAQGTPREAALIEEARLEVDSEQQLCRYWRQTQQSALLFGLGGVVAIIVSVLLLVISRKRQVVKV